jgi:hypothetical protein
MSDNAIAQSSPQLECRGYGTDDHYPNALRRHQGDHPSRCTQVPGNDPSKAGGSASVAFDLEHGLATMGSQRRGKASCARISSESKKVDGSSLRRKRWWLYRAHCGYGTSYTFLSRLRDIQREQTGRSHVVAWLVK